MKTDTTIEGNKLKEACQHIKFYYCYITGGLRCRKCKKLL